MIIFQGVHFCFPIDPEEGSHFALQDLSFQVAEGEFVGVLGPNGSGKSTLARLLNGLNLPTAGTVTVDGLATDDPAQLPAIRRKVQMIFQNPENQIIGSTVAEDVAFGLANIGCPADQIAARTARALDLVEMGALAERPVHQLSGGEKQKLAAASALALAPRYLVLDEATAMLDPTARRHFLDVLRDVRRQTGQAMIHITHNLAELLDADRLILLDHGEIQAEGHPRALLQQPDLLERCGIELPFLAALALRLHQDPEELVKRLWN
jgi:energy-coupling factor transport system ATP-binding protein